MIRRGAPTSACNVFTQPTSQADIGEISASHQHYIWKADFGRQRILFDEPVCPTELGVGYSPTSATGGTTHAKRRLANQPENNLFCQHTTLSIIGATHKSRDRVCLVFFFHFGCLTPLATCRISYRSRPILRYFAVWPAQCPQRRSPRFGFQQQVRRALVRTSCGRTGFSVENIHSAPI